jgi:hypothetical protein
MPLIYLINPRRRHSASVATKMLLTTVSAEYSDHLMAGYEINFAKRYLEGKMHVIVEFASRRNARKYDLVFFAIPDNRVQNLGGSAKDSIADEHAAGCKRDGDKSCMGGVTQLVKSPDGVIPSFVRLERHKKRKNFSWQVVSDFTFDDIGEPINVIPNGKLGLLGGDLTRCDRSSVTDLVKCGSKSFKSLRSGVGATVGNPFSELEFMELCNSICIQFYDTMAWCFFDKGLNSLVKAPNVIVCA